MINYSKTDFNRPKLNALAVQNPRYKCDLGNKNDSVFDCNNNYYNYYRLYYICVCALQLTSLQSPDPTSIRLEGKKLENSFVASITWVELEIDSHGRKLRASSKLQQPLLQLYFISSCDLIAIGFKQDELCFSELFWYQTSSESCETATVSYKNCHNTERF